ncbi:hypothetical protein [Algoriphagus namhaensis]
MTKLKSNPSKTVLVISTGLLLLSLVFDLKVLLYSSLAIGIAGILSDWVSEKIEWVWFKLTYLLSLIVPNILLGLVFFLVLTPIAFFAGLFKKKDTLLIAKPEQSSYSTLNKTYKAQDLKNPW